jgi:hypothetical protein
MRFVLNDKATREFAPQRFRFRGSVEDGISIGDPAPLHKLVSKYFEPGRMDFKQGCCEQRHPLSSMHCAAPNRNQGCRLEELRTPADVTLSGMMLYAKFMPRLRHSTSKHGVAVVDFPRKTVYFADNTDDF